MKKVHARLIILMTTAIMMVACSLFESDDGPPLPGTRVAALPLRAGLEPSQDLKMPDLPPAWTNTAWPQVGGFSGHSMQHLTLSSAVLRPVWSVDIGAGGTSDHPLTATPIVENNHIYTLDREGNVSAYAFETGARLWRVYAGSRVEDDQAIGGGIAAEGDVLFVTTGYAEVLALNAEQGREIWRVRLPAPARAAPTVLDGHVYVLTLNGQLLALDAHDGAMVWNYRAVTEGAGVLGGAAPAANADFVIAPFSTGEVFALRANNGSVAWSDNLAPPLRLGGLQSLADVRALPVIHEGVVLALSYGGRLLALEAETGARLWQRDVGGQDTPWVAGDLVYVLTKDAVLSCLDLKTGGVHWVLELPRFDDPNSHDHPVRWMGPVLAGGRLIVVGTGGRVFNVNPLNGQVESDMTFDELPAVPLVVAGGRLMTLMQDGTLTVWR